MGMEPFEGPGVWTNVNCNAGRTPGRLPSNTSGDGVSVSYSFTNNDNCVSNCVKVFHYQEEKDQVKIHPQPHPKGLLSVVKEHLNRRLMLHMKPGVLMCLPKALVLIILCRKAETRSGPIYSNIQLKCCS